MNVLNCNALTVDVVNDVIELADICYPPATWKVITMSNELLSDLMAPRPEFEALYGYVEGLSDLQRTELCALMYFGRRSERDFDEALAAAKGSANNHNFVHYIASKSPLATYLRNGLAKL